MIGNGPEYKFIEQIIEYISYTKVNDIRLYVAKYPVGVNSRRSEERRVGEECVP